MSALPATPSTTLLRSPVRRSIRLSAPARPGSKFLGQRVHFVGIGGSGMSGLAKMLLDCGAVVTGSDTKSTPATVELARAGARISSRQHGELLEKGIDVVVRTAAVPDTHPEVIAAAGLGLRVVKYAQLLGEVMQERLGVAIAGTHGKSTTTAMTAFALLECGLDPSFVVGGTVPQIGDSGSRSGSGDSFVAEACEYDRSFHNLSPTVAVITNIEEDHLDCYRDIYDIIESFRKFASLVPQDGVIIANGRDIHVAKVLMNLDASVETVSIGEPTVWSTQLGGIVNGCQCGDVYYHGRFVASLAMSIPGLYNLLNATMALAAAFACGADIPAAAEAIGRFRGVDRRMTEVGQFNSAIVIDDYGHHPTEIRKTLAAIRERYEPQRLFCVFQPHQHSRTRHLLEDFAVSFAAADEVIMPDIFFVRDSEEERHAVCTADLAKRIGEHGQSATHIPEFAKIVSHLRQTVRPGDLVVTMGAGNVNEIGRSLVFEQENVAVG